MRKRYICWLAAIVLVAGCSKSGPDLAPVSGRVTLDGQPVENADVTFQPEGSKSPSFGRTDKDGNYTLGYKKGVVGALVGKHAVQISTSPEIVKGPNRFPAKYNTNSELHRDVESGKNEINFDLTSK